MPKRSRYMPPHTHCTHRCMRGIAHMTFQLLSIGPYSLNEIRTIGSVPRQSVQVFLFVGFRLREECERSEKASDSCWSPVMFSYKRIGVLPLSRRSTGALD